MQPDFIFLLSMLLKFQIKYWFFFNLLESFMIKTRKKIKNFLNNCFINKMRIKKNRFFFLALQLFAFDSFET